MVSAKRPRCQLRVAVLGVSRAGLPLALLLADRGHQVVLVEKDVAALTSLKAGHYPFMEPGAAELLQSCLGKQCLQLSSEMSVIKGSEVIILAVTTPVDQRLIPDMSLVELAMKDLRPHLSGGETILLRATVFPGTCQMIEEKLAKPPICGNGQNGHGLLSVGVSFCPERLASGHVVEELQKMPQIVSGSTPRALSHALALFEPLSVDLVELSLLEAEVATLFLNAWRYVSFGTANQFYHIAVSKGLDFDKIRGAIIHRYQRATDFPRSGFTAGPRLYQDMMQLSAYCRHTFSLGNAAMLVNETMPDCLVEQARQKLLESSRNFKGLKCGILGMAFKPGSDDCSDSLAFKLRELLLREGAEVSCSDANSGEADFISHEKLLATSEAVFIGCPHAQYSKISFKKHQWVFDCWGLAREPPDLTISRAQGHQYLKVAVVGGAGHVGLPLSLVLADRGHTVVVVDKDAAKIESIQAGQFPFLEAGGPELLLRCLDSKPISFSTSVAEVSTCDVIIVTIGTPVNEHLNPCFSVVQACMEELRPHLRQGQTLLLRSTLFPGTSSRVLAGLPPGISVSFCPERIAQGKALEELTDLPQIISGSDAQALEHAKALFAPLSVDLIELNLQEAEVAKLFLNSWRYVAFGIANQFYHIATSKGLNFDRLRAAIVHRYPRAASFPRSGFTAGPCLFKDTMQLAAYCRHTFSLGHAAMLVNETMPDSLVEQARRQSGSLQGVSCGILGMAFKPDNDDWRESLAFKLRKLLLWEGASLKCTDVYMQREGFVSLSEVLQSDILFLGCPHAEYQHISIRSDQKLYDCWGFFAKPKLSISTPFS